MSESQRTAEDFERIAREEERGVYLTCLYMLGSRQDAYDAVQETMLKAWRGYQRFRFRAKWSTWFHRIAVNTCIDMLRKRRPETSLDDLSDQGFDAPDQSADSFGQLESRERRRALFAALRALDDKDRMIVVLRDIRGLSYEDLARTLLLPEGTVKSRLNRARAKLRQALGDQMELFSAGHVNDSERGDTK